RLAEDTHLQFTELALADGARLTQLTLLRGTATFYANLSSDDRFSVATPHFTVILPRNARFRIDAGDDGATVSVLKGDITVEALGASYRVTKNRAFLFRVAGEQVTLARAPETDAWDRWVEDRENILSASHQATSLRYARAPFSYGMSDLDYYGGWYNLPGYGYGWQPRGISIGWSPYCSGQWMYVGGFLTWVSFEPWGWTPYHYGNWVYVRNGWFWMPGGFHQWQPAIVYWVHLGGNRWGWGPRGPHDRPGQPPANLPHGTVVPTSNPRGYTGVDRRNDRPTPGDVARGRVVFEPPDSFGEVTRPRGRAATGSDGVSPPTAPGAPAASGFSGSPRSSQPGDVARDERADPRARGRAGEAGPASGIVYDPRDRRYVNAPEVPGRTGAPGRSESAETPAAPVTRGYSGTPAAPTEPRKPPTVEVRREDRPEIQRNENRMPGRREPEQGNSPASVRPWQQPRQEAQPQQRPPSAPAPQAQPRNDQPRPAPAPQPRWESQPRPAPQSQPQPRFEPARPPSPPPAPTPQAQPHERPNTKPPGNR
ncbi:MAG: FecR domain-containing protein, partial [Acidobacteria bacterium]|nr:FecR domain-containing protein [Acidobacteriota bacterium]